MYLLQVSAGPHLGCRSAAKSDKFKMCILADALRLAFSTQEKLGDLPPAFTSYRVHIHKQQKRVGHITSLLDGEAAALWTPAGLLRSCLVNNISASSLIWFFQYQE